MLGDMPGLVSGRSTPNYVEVVAPGRQHEAAFDRMAEGYREFGRGITQFGRGLQEFGESQYAKEEKLNGAMATANSTIYEDNVKASIENETDPEKIKQILGGLDQGYASAGSNLSGDQAKLFGLQSQHRANSLRLAGEKRIGKLEEDSFKAAATGTLNDLQNAYSRGDDATRLNSLQSAEGIIDGMVAKGYITEQQAAEGKNNFVRNGTMSFIQNQPVDKQFELLGVSKPGSVAAKDLRPHETAFLNALAGPESAGKYNVRYTPGGGATFNSFADHPRIYEKGPDGPSSAAGRYQFVASTWDKVVPGQFKQGGFTPENQDHAALWYARQVYREKTGGDLDQELQANGVSDKVVSALGNTWRGLRDNPRKARSWYQATINNAPNAEGSYEIASSSGGVAHLLSPEDHSKLVNNAFATKKKELELSNAQTKAEIEHADETYYSRLTDNKLDNLLEDIQNDPVLKQHPKEQLQMMDVAKRHIAAIEKNKGGDFGPGYTEGFDGVMKGDITTNQQLYQMAQEGKLTVHGVQQLKTMIGDLRSKPEKAVEQKIIAGQLAYAKSKLIGPMNLYGKNSPGEQTYNSTFVPAFYSRYQAWVKSGKDPMDFLTKENTDKIIKEIKPDAFAAAQDRVTAGVEDKKPVQTGPETVLPPPNGVNVPQEKWNGLMQVRPNAPTGKPISVFNWSAALRGLVSAPTAKNRAWFNQAFPGANADKILSELGVPAQ